MADFRIFSWNVNGLRAVLRKGSLKEFIEKEQPDVLCLQEIKCNPNQLDLFELNTLKGYNVFWHPAKRPGYSGTATLVHKSCQYQVQTEAPSLSEGINKLATDEGRILCLDFGKFYLVNVYTPNSKPDLSRLQLRYESWDPEYRNYLKELEKEKPVVTCGDFNCAHQEIDLARPKTNHRNAGFTDEEREGIDNLIGACFTDSFRKLHPKAKRYTWWSHWGNARANNVGWRIDYFFVSNSLLAKLKDAEIYELQQGSDHCPISITLETD
ncbi:exodeoxyribonuclease III [Candidatus Saccharibacteria bacterium]|nr:exodeoxyribonuclease III [Candidatus Saccharibacteria bacterium]